MAHRSAYMYYVYRPSKRGRNSERRIPQQYTSVVEVGWPWQERDRLATYFRCPPGIILYFSDASFDAVAEIYPESVRFESHEIETSLYSRLQCVT